MIESVSPPGQDGSRAAGEDDFPAIEPALRWYAIRVRSNFEASVAAVLSARGYEIFCPTYHVRRRRGVRTVEAALPVFSGYTFARFWFGDRLPIVSTSGVVHVVTSGKRPLPIPNEEIESIRELIERGRGVRPCPFVRAGDVVKIVSGPLAGLTGVLLEDGGRSRLAVSITILQRSISAEVDGDSIQFVRRGKVE